MRLLRVLALSCLMLGVSSAANAAELGVQWDAPRCADEREFRTLLQSALRRTAKPLSSQGSSVRVTIAETTAGQFELRVETLHEGRRLQRELVTGSCEEALEAAALVVALTIDPDAELPPRSEVARAAPAEVGESEAGLVTHASLSSGVSVAELPGPAFLLTLGAGVQWARWRAELSASAVAPRYARARSLPEGDERGGDIALIGGGLAFCYALPQRSWWLATCLGAQAGIWRARGVGVRNPRARAELWLAGSARLRLGLPVSEKVALTLQGELLVLGSRPEFFLEDLGTVYRPAPVGGRSAAGFEFYF